MRTDRKVIIKELIGFSLPLILSGVLQQLYSWADAFIIGHAEGELQLGAVGATSSISVFLINAMIGFTVGLSILAAQEYGRGNKDKITAILADFQPILIGIFLVLSVLAIVFSRTILTWMNTPTEIFDYGLSYLRIIFIGVPFLALYNLYASLLRAAGNTKVAFYAVLISSVLNVIGDILLVVVVPFGVAGAAAATVFSQISMTVFIVIYARIKYPEFMRFEDNREERFSLLRHGTSFGMPPALQNSVTSLGNLILQNFMNGFGAATVLAITTAYRVDSIMLLVFCQGLFPVFAVKIPCFYLGNFPVFGGIF